MTAATPASLAGLAADLLAATGLDLRAPATITGPEDLLPSPFRITAAATASVAAVNLALAELHATRGGGERPAVVLDTRDALASCMSERFLQIDGQTPTIWDDLSGFYEAADGSWVQLHTNFPHHRAAVLTALGCGDSRAEVAAAIGGLAGLAVEDAVLAAGGCAARARSAAEWAREPHARAVAALPPVTVATVPAAPAPASASQPTRPLAGVRVLDLTRVIAGPVATRTLAAHGAEVLRVGAPDLPVVTPLLADTGFGKRFTHLDLRTEPGAAELRDLVREADVVVSSFRPGALDRYGFGAQQLHALRPGLVVVTVDAWGATGPWGGRRGYDSLVQTATGLAVEQAGAEDRPRHLPAQILDHATGQLAALAAVAGLVRRARGGQGTTASVTLAGTARWLDRLGRRGSAEADARGGARPFAEIVAARDLLEDVDTGWGVVRHVKPVGGLAGHPARWDRPPPRPGDDPPRWLPR